MPAYPRSSMGRVLGQSRGSGETEKPANSGKHRFQFNGDGMKRSLSKYYSSHCWWCQPCNLPVDGPMAALAVCHGCGRGSSSDEIIHFDSKRERARWQELCHYQSKGLVSNIKLQAPFPIEINGVKIGTYRCDFQYNDIDGVEIIEDVKGMMTPLSAFKIKCAEAQYGISISIVK